MLETTKKNNLSKLKTSKGRLWQVKQKEKKRFKVKTRKGGLNQNKKKEKGQVENLKGRFDQEKRSLD